MLTACGAQRIACDVLLEKDDRMGRGLERYGGESDTEWYSKVPDVFKRHPLERFINAEDVVRSLYWLWSRWPPTSTAYQEVSYLLDHYEGDFDGSPASLSDSRL